jgi:hypothetical protein
MKIEMTCQSSLPGQSAGVCADNASKAFTITQTGIAELIIGVEVLIIGVANPVNGG